MTLPRISETSVENVRPRSRGTLVVDVVTRLRDGILFGRFAPGQRLIEADLTRDYGVSRGSIREALRQLSEEGMVESIPNRGAVVRRLSFKEVAELFEIRTALECLAARLAAEKVADSAVRKTFETTTAPIWSDQPRNAMSGYLEENKLFHQAVAATSGNDQLAALGRRMQLPLIMYQMSGFLTSEILATSNAEHRAIATAILDRDADAAEQAMRVHLERASRFAYELPPELFRP